MPNKLIVITGLDGSGTTTIAQRLVEEDRNGYLMATPDSPYKNFRKEIDITVLIDSVEAHYYFYLSSLIHASEKIKLLLTKHNVYCVRYLIDTVVSHRVAGMDVTLEYITSFYKIIPPNVSLFIEIDENIRQERITRRGKDILDKVLDCEETRQRFLNEFKMFQSHLHIINNSGALSDSIRQARLILQKAGVYNG